MCVQSEEEEEEDGFPFFTSSSSSSSSFLPSSGPVGGLAAWAVRVSHAAAFHQVAAQRQLGHGLHSTGDHNVLGPAHHRLGLLRWVEKTTTKETYT
jgi:hypothetical protein